MGATFQSIVGALGQVSRDVGEAQLARREAERQAELDRVRIASEFQRTRLAERQAGFAERGVAIQERLAALREQEAAVPQVVGSLKQGYLIINPRKLAEGSKDAIISVPPADEAGIDPAAVLGFISAIQESSNVTFTPQEVALLQGRVAEAVTDNDLTPVMNQIEKIFEERKKAAGKTQFEGAGVTLMDEVGQIAGVWFPQTGAMVTPPAPGLRTGALSPTEVEQQTSLQSVSEEAAHLWRLTRKEEVRKTLGPVAGRLYEFEAETEWVPFITASPEVIDMQRTSRNLGALLLLARSGKQTSELEHARLSRLVPQPTDPPRTFDIKLAAFMREVNRLLELRRAGGQPELTRPKTMGEFIQRKRRR